MSPEEEEGALQRELSIPNDRRMWAMFRALDRGWTVEELHELTKIDRWFLTQFAQIVELGQAAALVGLRGLSTDMLRTLKRAGIGDRDLGALLGDRRRGGADRSGSRPGLKPAYKRIDTCAAEFESFTPYLYGTYEKECEADPTPRQKVVILGSGPNRIGQGIEFDYCCCHAAFALREEGYETVMVNCNPETVSTDYDTVDRLFFEPLTFEDVSAIIAREQEAGGDVACVVQYGGQTPLKLALPLQEAGIRILGTSPDSIDLAEDRERFAKLLWDLGIPQAASGTATTPETAREVAAKIGFPLVVRPSYVLGGRAMAIVYDMSALDRYMLDAVAASPGHPILIDKFLEDAVELDVDAVADTTGAVVIGGIMEHIEEAGIHSGDSSCVVPPLQDHRAPRRADPRLHAAGRPGAEGHRPDERAVRDQGRHGLRARGQPAGVADGAVSVEGHRCAAGQGRGAGDGRPDAGAAGPDPGPRGLGLLRQDAGVPVRAVPRRRHHPRARDEVDGRSHGRRGDLRHRIRQGAARRRREAAARGLRVHLASTTTTSPRSCRSRATSPDWASSWWRRAARPTSCARTGWTWRSCSRSTKAARTSATRS